MNKKLVTTPVVLCAILLLSACVSSQNKKEEAEELATTTYYLGKRAVLPSAPVPPAPAPVAKAAVVQGIVYFDFDKHNIKPEYDSVIAKHAQVLRDNPKLMAKVEGNTDVLGSDDYNTPLGLLRAKEVRNALLKLGVREQQLEPVSYSFDFPAAPGRDAVSRAKNRRVEISYQN